MGNISSEHILCVNCLLHTSETNWKQDKKENKDCLCLTVMESLLPFGDFHCLFSLYVLNF